MTMKAETYGPSHYNSIINTEVDFFGGQGNSKTTLYEAARMASASAAGLRGRAKAHYSASDTSDLTLEKEQYGRLSALVGSIDTAVAALMLDLPAFDEGATVDTAARIQSASDVKEVCVELEAISKSITTNYLTGGSNWWFNWYLPDYMAALEKLAASQTLA